MTDEQPIIIIVDDHMSEETQEMLQSEARRHGMHQILIVAAGLMAMTSRLNGLIAEFGRIQACIPDVSSTLLSAKGHLGAAPSQQYYRHSLPQARMINNNLTAHHNYSAKWGSGAHNARHRSRENRHAEAQRNVAAYNKHYKKG